MSAFDRLPQAIRWLRIRRHLTQAELAQAAGVSRSWLSSFERGDARPSLPTLEALLTALAVDLGAVSAAMEDLAGRPDIGRRRYRRPRVSRAVRGDLDVSVRGFRRFLELMAGQIAGAPAERGPHDCR